MDILNTFKKQSETLSTPIYWPRTIPGIAVEWNRQDWVVVHVDEKEAFLLSIQSPNLGAKVRVPLHEVKSSRYDVIFSA